MHIHTRECACTTTREYVCLCEELHCKTWKWDACIYLYIHLSCAVYTDKIYGDVTMKEGSGHATRRCSSKRITSKMWIMVETVAKYVESKYWAKRSHNELSFVREVNNPEGMLVSVEMSLRLLQSVCMNVCVYVYMYIWAAFGCICVLHAAHQPHAYCQQVHAHNSTNGWAKNIHLVSKRCGRLTP